MHDEERNNEPVGDTTEGHAPSKEDPSGEPEQLGSEPEMIAQMKRYRALKQAQESQKQRAKEYLEQVKAEIEEDMRPLEEQIEAARRSMLAFLTEHNGSNKFRVPGLGTAFTQHRVSVKIEDETAFDASLNDAERAQVFESKLNQSRAKALVAGSYEDDGEIRPGCEVEEKETLAGKLSG